MKTLQRKNDTAFHYLVVESGWRELLALLFVLLFALLLYVQLRFLPLLLTAFIFLSSGTHNDLSFLGQRYCELPHSI